ncbi:hypothetical protein OG455_22065 [Kitasatospora sp. NBC_01287]|uniref:WXG100-like domain-containing protein n=1 Tax=Kitasatospora sp. NBC_01287 TaxID=2903573 RepID=UPI002257EEC9|nr:hypothetical protein [Kitasatospora sp. NBC_01287]MCX4748164.1 hypothetical protein [Kitasatospora sp. NBC_01287]
MGAKQDAEKIVRKLTGMWWPDADEDGLRQVATAWNTLADAIDSSTATANSTAQGVIHGNSGPAVSAFDTFWARYYTSGSGWLPDASASCRAMAKACSQYADQIAAAKKKLEEEVALVGGVLIAGTTLAFFTGGLSEGAAIGASAAIVSAADALGVTVATAVADIAGTVLTGAAFGAVESATIDLAVAQPIKIGFGDQKGISATEILDSAGTGALAGGFTSGMGAGAKALSVAADGSGSIAPSLAAIATRLPTALDSLPGRMIVGAGVGAGQDALFDGGNVNLLDVLSGAIGGAAGKGKGAQVDGDSLSPADAQQLAGLRNQGHAPGRHLDPDDPTLQRRLGTTITNPDGTPKTYTSSSSNAGHVKSKDHIDPLTGTTVDGDTGGVHKCGPYATRYNDPKALVDVDNYMRQKISSNGGALPPTSTPIEDILGPSGHLKFTGFYKDPANPGQYLPVDFEGGNIIAVYVPDGNGGYNLVTSYANPAPGRHP